ncbi:DNA helicase, DnaB-like, C-terminal [uncultured Caudovirales phage]|uniref:DNA helicase, DnaB-like, C-terminal n=1 Tax=uncultured Caudovirales phage TaxID=2100421 RepID=A0A6J5LJB2_9CAUD|nr:DNA helicase, DnaB-like, C-terminal [uncultured Caudovirales phage]
MDISAIVLNKLLTERSVDIWARIKLAFIDPSFSSLYSAIAKYYEQYSNIPSFDELELTLREGPASRSLATVRLADNPDISSEVALNALVDQYTQNEVVRQLDKFIDKLPIYDTNEVKENLASIVFSLDEKTYVSDGVCTMTDILLFPNEAELSRQRIHLGFNNIFDAQIAGLARQEVLAIGGKRGSGKSIVCSNLQVNQYESGNTSVYFTIEMTAREVLERNIAIGSGVSHASIKKGELTDEELLKVVQYRAGMFVDADDLVEEFKRTRDKYKFESRLVREKILKPDNQMIIVDDSRLTLTAIDLYLTKLKAKFGDKLTLAVIDYMNVIVSNGSRGQYDWQEQTTVSKGVKDLARKHDLAIGVPYQIDAAGEARFGKGILDAVDIALLMEAHDKSDQAVSFTTTKIRGSGDIACTSPINWDTLRISPIPISKPISVGDGEDTEKKAHIKRATKKDKKESLKQDDSSADMPPWS